MWSKRLLVIAGALGLAACYGPTEPQNDYYRPSVVQGVATDTSTVPAAQPHRKQLRNEP